VYTWLIYFILPAFYRYGRSLWVCLMVLTQLYPSSHPLWPFHGIHGVQEMQVSVMMTHNAQMVRRLLWGVLKLGLRVHHSNGEGDVAQPQPIHWYINDSLRNSHIIRVKCAGALSCWNDTCYIIPLLLGSGIS